VRATALSLLNTFSGEETTRAYALSLMDDEALIRRVAVENLNVPDVKRQTKLVAPLLYDPVKAVRTQAASMLAGEPSKHLDAKQKQVFETALNEFVASMEYSGDFAFGRYNLGNLYSVLNRTEDAIRSYRAAIKIDDLFYPAKVNLAMLFNKYGENDKAEVLLREVVAAHPDMYEIAYSLGLLLAEMKKYDHAVVYLDKAAKGIPGRSRIHYNLGLILQHLKRGKEAEASLIKALELDENSLDYLYALADYYMKRRQYHKAKILAEQMISRHPTNRIGHELLKIIKKDLSLNNR
jgi:Tfp pilus assembly protein PilF